MILSAPSPGGSVETVCTVPFPKVWSSPTITARWKSFSAPATISAAEALAREMSTTSGPV